MTDIEFEAECKKIGAILEKINSLMDEVKVRKQALWDEVCARQAA